MPLVVFISWWPIWSFITLSFNAGLAACWLITAVEKFDSSVYEGITHSRVDQEFVYCSGTNKDFLSVSQLREIISNYNIN